MKLRPGRLDKVFTRELIEVDMPFIRVKISTTLNPSDIFNKEIGVYSYFDDLVAEYDIDKVIVNAIETLGIKPALIILGKKPEIYNVLESFTLFKYFGLDFLFIEGSDTKILSDGHIKQIEDMADNSFNDRYIKNAPFYRFSLPKFSPESLKRDKIAKPANIVIFSLSQSEMRFIDQNTAALNSFK